MLPELNHLVAQPATLHTVHNFNPADYLTCYTNSDGTKVYYLEVKYRILWFRLCYPLGRIQVKILLNDAEQVIAEARIYVDMAMPEDHFIGQAIAHKYKAADMTENYDLLEWTCTAAVGRALSMAGFGQQFCDMVSSFSEPEQVDSPTAVLASSKPSEVQLKQTAANIPPANDITADWDMISEAIDFGDDTILDTSASNETNVVQLQSNDSANTSAVAVEQLSANKRTAKTNEQQGGQQSNQQRAVSTPEVQANTKTNTSRNKQSNSQATNNNVEAAPKTSNDTIAKSEPTSLEEALEMLSPQECLKLTINFGFNQGKNLGDLYQAGDTKSLEWLANTYRGRDYTIKAGAQILLTQLQAS